ncbi:MAG: MCE family protein [Acidobacteria bacterium]|nr:MCE family protein [Acidobacteriota bacterium]
MEPKREQALVGLFVLVAAALLLVTLFALTGVFVRSTTNYRAYFKFAGGLEPGAEVRYAGGPRSGRVEGLRIDPQDPSRIEITFSVKPEIPVKKDSTVRIMSLSPLGENHLEITAGSAPAPRARAGDVLQAEPYVDFNAITAQLNALGPEARQLIETLNERATELKESVVRVNDLLSAENRANLSGTLGNVRGMLEENRPKLKSTMTHVDTASAKLGPLIEDFKKTVKQADEALAHIDAMIGENRADVRKAVADLRQTLASASSLTSQLDRTLNVNAENIDELLENMRHTTENLKEFTDTIKARPSTLIRSSGPPDRKPGQSKQP